MSSIGHYPPQRGRYRVVDFQTGKTLYDTDSLQQAKQYVLESPDYSSVDIIDSETHKYYYFDGSAWLMASSAS